MRDDIERRRPGRKIGYHHFAMFRGYLDGIPLKNLGDLYLETGTDLRQADRTLRWVRDELVAAARRYQTETGLTQSSLARMLRIEPAQLKPEERIALAEVPGLEEFQADYDPVGFYSEAELIEEFQKRYSGDGKVPADVLRRAERNERLRRHIRQAVSTLEIWLATSPKPSDPITLWLEPVVADRLTPVGIVSVEDLVALINRHGNLWYRRIPKFGAVRARRVVRWLKINKVMPLDDRALVPYRQIVAVLPSSRSREFGIVPLDHLQLPVELSGITGANRAFDSMMEIPDDLAAVAKWIEFKAENPNTRRTYQAQIERFLLWLVQEKNRPLSSAMPEDCKEYVAFLEALGAPGAEWQWRLPRAAWVGDKRPRWSSEWKPFAGVTTERTRALAVTVLKGLFVWLVEIGYLRRTPWSNVKTPAVSGKRIKVDHAINARQWRAVLDELAAMPQDERYFRLRIILMLGYTGGLRQDEMIRLDVTHLQRTPDGDWELKVRGKGGKLREVPVARAVFGHLQDYMETRGHGRNPIEWRDKRVTVPGRIVAAFERPLPLLSALTPGMQRAQKTKDLPLSARAMSQLLKSVFDAAAERLEDLIDAHLLRQASAHWLRHTSATEMINHGIPVVDVQEILGHADSATTALYTHADRKRKRAAVEVLCSTTSGA